jgi:prepilin-type N-terminal cleavage/methylation domain-containing protein
MRTTLSRRGFTLLEVILALSVGVLLLGALYVAVDVQLRHARAGRNVVEQATLARSILARIDADIAATATLVDAERYRMSASTTSGYVNSSGGSGGGGSGGSSGGTTSGGATSGGTPTGSNSSASGTSGSSSSTSGSATEIFLPLSVQGDSTSLNLFIGRVPREALPTDPSAASQTVIVNDIRRVSWWMPSSGLARQEVAIQTSQDALENLPPGIADEDSYVLAREVKNLQFQYFDGTDWQDSWDCTQLGTDGLTPIGPPQAIAVTIEIAIPQDGITDDEAPTKRYRHVVACFTANGTTPQQLTSQQQSQQQQQQQQQQQNVQKNGLNGVNGTGGSTP